MITVLSEHEVFLLVLQLGVIILAARLCGMIAQKFGQPIIVGEILAGVLLGPFVLGRLSPEFHHLLFPNQGVLKYVIQGISWLCVLFLLMMTGLEIDIRASFRHPKRTILISLFSLFFPFLFIYLSTKFLPADFYPKEINPVYVNLLLATSLSVVAIPVIAKILFDLKIFTSFVGLSIMTAGVFCDIWGWSALGILIALINGSEMSLFGILKPLALMGIYLTLAVTMGRWVIDKFFDALDVKIEDPTTVFAFIFALALINGAIAHLLGLHVILGAFVAGLIAGESSRLTPYLRQSIQDMVFAIFAPIFFALIGMQLSFESVKYWPYLIMLFAASSVFKIGGAFIGALMGGIGQRNAFAVGMGLNTQGTMGIIIALIGIDLGVFNEQIFSAVVFICIASTILVGPALKWAIKGVKRPLSKYFDQEHVFLDVEGLTKKEIIGNMTSLMKERNIIENPTSIQKALSSREDEMSTAIGEGVALPHARIDDLPRPILCFFRLKNPVDFSSPDNQPVQLLFLELTDNNDDGMQLNLITQVARFIAKPQNRKKLLTVEKAESISHLLSFDEKA